MEPVSDTDPAPKASRQWAFRSVPHEEPALCFNPQLPLLHGDVQQSTVTQQNRTVQQQEAARHDPQDEAVTVEKTIDELLYTCNMYYKGFKLKSSKDRHEKAFHSAGGNAAFACPLYNK